MILFITAAQAFLPVLLFQIVQNIPLYTGAVHCPDILYWFLGDSRFIQYGTFAKCC